MGYSCEWGLGRAASHGYSECEGQDTKQAVWKGLGHYGMRGVGEEGGVLVCVLWVRKVWNHAI